MEEQYSGTVWAFTKILFLVSGLLGNSVRNLYGGISEGSILVQSHTFVEIDHEIISAAELSETQNYAYWYARFFPETHDFR